MKLYTVLEASKELDVNRDYIYRYIKANNIKKVGEGYLKASHLKAIKKLHDENRYNYSGNYSGLTQREMKVLEIVAIHFDHKKLAARELEISFRTLQSHLANIRVKMGIGSTKECIDLAKRLKLI